MEWTLLAPLVLLLVVGNIQVALVAHGRLVALDAAAAGAEIEAAAGGQCSGADAALAMAVAGGVLGAEVTVSGDADQITVTVGGRVQALVDLGTTDVTAQATRPRERVSDKP